MSEDLSRFRRVVDPFLPDWKSIDLRVVAHKAKDGAWLFNSVRATLDPEPPTAATRKDLPSTPNLLVVNERWDIGRLDDLLDSISKGELLAASEPVRIMRHDGQNWHPVISGYYRLLDRDRARSECGLDFATATYNVWETLSYVSDQDGLTQAEGSLRSDKIPWDGIADLSRNFVGFRGNKIRVLEASALEIVAPLGVRLSKSTTLTGSKIRIMTETLPGTDYAGIVLSVVARLQDGSTFRNRCPTEHNVQDQWSVVELPSAPSNLSVFATYRGMDVDRMDFFTVTNPRLSVLGALGLNLENLQSLLETARGRNLERWYAVLLQILGFSAAHYGGTSLGTPDIIAFPDSQGWLLVVECTQAEPDIGNKLTKLSTRTKQVRQAVEGLEAHPVLVTAMSRTLLNTTDVQKAAVERISLVTADELPALILMARKGVNPGEVRDYLVSLIPRTA